MKKLLMLLFVSIAVTALFHSCKKDTADSVADAKLYLLKTEITTNGITLEGRCGTTVGPDAVGVMIVPVTIGTTSFSAYGGGYFWFYNQAGIVPGLATMSVTIDGPRRLPILIYFFGNIIQSTVDPTLLAELNTPQDRLMNIPVNKTFYVTIHGLNRCGQWTTYVATFILSTTTREDGIDQPVFDRDKVETRYYPDDQIKNEEMGINQLQKK